MIETALQYAGRGWAVLPCKDKAPLVRGGVHSATRDPATIGRWWCRWPQAEIAIACGAPSGVVVIDIDVPAEVPELLDLQTLAASTPSGGRHLYFQHPGGTIRNDTGVFEGAEISVYYDPMIAKLVTHAATREAAIDLQSHALDAFVIDGVEHNIPFLAAVMQHPRWREGRLSTGFIAEEFKGGFKPRVPRGEELQLLAAVAIAIDHLGNARRRQITDQMGGPAVRFASRRIAVVGNERVEALVEGTLGAPIQVTFLDRDGQRRATLKLKSDWWPGAPVWSGMVRDKPVCVQVRPILNGFALAHKGFNARTHVYTEEEATLAALMPKKAAPDTSKLLLCPMPGLVKAIHVGPGQEIKVGDALCVVEAMKMENILRAERDGTVKAVKAKPGDSLAVDAVILEFV